MSLEFRGQKESELEAEAVRWVEGMVVDQIYPEARDLVSDHLERGHVVAVVSGATQYVVAPIARCLGIEHALYTRLEVVDGLFTGSVVEPVCFEEGKIYWLEKFIEEQGISLAKSWFYTDSVTDLPLLDLVGHPVVTNPDHMLYRMARKRRWPVKFFTPPNPSR
jgi:putative phosphoserine phosphatase/1-acylglycerol-3-phosphate O-acyltransferase